MEKKGEIRAYSFVCLRKRLRTIGVLETEDEVGVLVFNCADHEVNPWPEVQLPKGCIAKTGSKFVDLLAPTPETFLVNDGGKIYAGPCGPNRYVLGLSQIQALCRRDYG